MGWIEANQPQPPTFLLRMLPFNCIGQRWAQLGTADGARPRLDGASAPIGARHPTEAQRWNPAPIGPTAQSGPTMQSVPQPGPDGASARGASGPWFCIGCVEGKAERCQLGTADEARQRLDGAIRPDSTVGNPRKTAWNPCGTLWKFRTFPYPCGRPITPWNSRGTLGGNFVWNPAELSPGRILPKKCQILEFHGTLMGSLVKPCGPL